MWDDAWLELQVLDEGASGVSESLLDRPLTGRIWEWLVVERDSSYLKAAAHWLVSFGTACFTLYIAAHLFPNRPALALLTACLAATTFLYRAQIVLAICPIAPGLSAVTCPMLCFPAARGPHCASRPAFLRARSLGAVHAQMQTWVKTYLECCILAKVDRASMMHSLEVRAPYLDPQLTQALANLPPNLIFRRGKGKQLFRKVGQKMLPPAILNKPKKGFGVPQATWLKTILRERMEAALDRNREGG